MWFILTNLAAHIFQDWSRSKGHNEGRARGNTRLERTEHEVKQDNKNIQTLHLRSRNSFDWCHLHLMTANLEIIRLLTAQPARPGSAPGCPRPPAPCPGGTDFWPAAPHSCWSTHTAESSGLREEQENRENINHFGLFRMPFRSLVRHISYLRQFALQC